MKANLHTHSIYSDGSDSPEQIVKLAKEAGVELLSLTDHNSLAGYPRFEKICRELGMNYVKGVEIDCIQPEIGFHQELLAYFPNGGEECITEVLERKQKARQERVERALKRAGEQFQIENLSLKELEDMAIAEKGFVGMLSNKLMYQYLQTKNMELPSYDEVQKQAYWKYIWKREGADNADKLWDLIKQISENGGYPVLAHFGFHCEADPVKMREHNDEYVEQLCYMKSLGLWGIELHPYRYYPQKDEINTIVQDWALKVDLNLTTGSDYHGGKVSAHKIFEWYGIEFNGFKR